MHLSLSRDYEESIKEDFIYLFLNQEQHFLRDVGAVASLNEITLKAGNLR